MTTPIAIFPAAGALGASTLTHLLGLVDPAGVVLIARHPSKLEGPRSKGATIRQADFDDAASLVGTFEGVTTLNLISYASTEIEHRFNVAKLAIDSALASGVSHIFYSSLAFAGESDSTSLANVMQAHLQTEAYLASLAASNSSFTFTVVRQGLYSESFPMYTSSFDLSNPTDSIRIPHDGGGPGLAWAKRDELGEATARLMADYLADPKGFSFVNKTLLLSGPRVVTLNETAAIIGRAIGKPLSVEKISLDDFAALGQDPTAAARLVYGSPADASEWLRGWATAWDAIRAGEAAV